MTTQLSGRAETVPAQALRTASERIRRSLSLGLHGDFLEVYGRAPVVILQPDVSGIRPRPANRLVPRFARRHFLMADAGKLVDHLAVQPDDRLLPLERNIHGVPLARRLLIALRNFAQRVDRPGPVPLVPPAAALHFVAVMHRDPPAL